MNRSWGIWQRWISLSHPWDQHPHPLLNTCLPCWKRLQPRDLKLGEKTGNCAVMKDGTTRAIYLESKHSQKVSWGISSVGANEIWVRKTSAAPRWGCAWASFSVGSLWSAGDQWLDFLQCSSPDLCFFCFLFRLVFGFVFFQTESF